MINVESFYGDSGTYFISVRVGLDPIDCKSSLTSNGTEEVLRMAAHQAYKTNKTEILDHGYNDKETDPELDGGPKFIPG